MGSKSHNPLVSVIIPTYNRAHLVNRAVHSVLSQTWQDFEIIVVDDDSTDNTEEVIKGFNDPRIRYIRHEQNHGASTARNTGIRAAHGEYTAFLDSDDEWLPLHLERKLQLIQEAKADGVIGSSLITLGDRWVERQCKPKPPTLPMAEYVLSGAGLASTCTMVLRRAAVAQVLFDETLTNYEDWDLIFRFEQKYKLVIDPVPTVLVYSDSLDRRSPRLNQAATKRFLRRYQAGLSPETKARFCLLLALKTYRSEGRTEHYRDWVREARAASPRRLVLKGLTVGLATPVLDGMVLLLLNGYFQYKERKAARKPASGG